MTLHIYKVTTANQARQENRSIERQREQEETNERREAEHTATDLYRSYLQLVMEKPTAFKKGGPRQAGEFIMATAESIFIADGDDLAGKKQSGKWFSIAKALLKMLDGTVLQ